MRIFSFGGGVQSTAVMVLQAQGKLPNPYDYFVFANVGDDSEHPDTLRYIQEYSKPFAKEHGIELIELRKEVKGEIMTLRNHIMGNYRSIPIPMRMGTTAPGNRTCTVDFKIKIVDRWARQLIREQTKELAWMKVGLGISTDEIHRAKIEPPDEIYKDLWKVKEYPLIDMMLSRNQCSALVFNAGLPVPPKSSCYFCPFHTDAYWRELQSKRPDLFNDAVKIDKHLREKRTRLCPKDAVYMHRSLKPLDVAIAEQGNFFDELDNCEDGYCFT